MPGKKRSRWDEELLEEEELPKRNKGPNMENGISPGRRPNSRASDKGKFNLLLNKVPLSVKQIYKTL